MAAIGGGGEDIDDKDAKHLLDSIGKKVYKEVHGDALERSKGKLKGLLSSATFRDVASTPSDPCELKHGYHTNVTNGNSHPCGNGTKERFSDIRDGECDKNKISGNKDDEGACAPFRRLHLCHRNLEEINDYENINNHTLLLDIYFPISFVYFVFCF